MRIIRSIALQTGISSTLNGCSGGDDKLANNPMHPVPHVPHVPPQSATNGGDVLDQSMHASKQQQVANPSKLEEASPAENPQSLQAAQDHHAGLRTADPISIEKKKAKQAEKMEKRKNQKRDNLRVFLANVPEELKEFVGRPFFTTLSEWSEAQESPGS